MDQSRINCSLEQSASDPHEAVSPSDVSEGSAVGAFIMLLVASGIAAVSFFLASPDRARGGDTAMDQVRVRPQ